MYADTSAIKFAGWRLRSKVRFIYLAFNAINTSLTSPPVLMRIGSTKNISKITKSMKMVSAAKMRGAETRLLNGRPFAVISKIGVIYIEICS